MILEPNNHIIRHIKMYLDIYYPTIHEVAVASNLSRCVADAESFLKALIEILQRPDCNVRVADMVDLLDTHKQSYWLFLHEVSISLTQMHLRFLFPRYVLIYAPITNPSDCESQRFM